MADKEAKHKQGSATHSTSTASVDTTETGPSRLYAPGKPREVESGPSRLHTSASGGHSAVISARPHTDEGLDATETGPARIGQYRG
jgi:hypothetical protein